MSEAQTLASSKRSYQIAPAGCGKTQLIADSVAFHPDGRALILTHTHAGVDAMRRRLRLASVKKASFEIDTIAGWSLRYASAFPAGSGLSNSSPESNKDWTEVYVACGRLFHVSPIRDIISASYSGVFVDEYQDCSVEQHEIICKLAEILPCRLLGDPLQSIFGFNQTEMVDWKRHVEPTFSALPELTRPWRWERAGNLDLGTWLLNVRGALLAGSPVNLLNRPVTVTWVQASSDIAMQHRQRLGVLKEAAKNEGSVLAIMKWERECNKLVSSLPFQYGNLEVLACDDLMKAALALDNSIGQARMEIVVEFACSCSNGLTAELKSILPILRGKKQRQKKLYKREVELGLLATVIASPSFEAVSKALDGLARTPNVTLWRKELHFEMLRSLREYCTGAHPTLKAAAWSIRNRTRHSERRLVPRIVSRTLLVKGLEFDHCVVLDADALNKQELYVALTRGSKTLTIVSRSTSLKPA